MKNIIFLMGFLSPLCLLAQEVKLSGSVADTSLDKKLQNAVVSVLRESDSTLVKYMRTDADGKFTNQVPPGNYILLITYPTYADFVTRVKVKSNDPVDFKVLPLLSKARILEEIIVRQQAIRIKGDTTEYMADSFYVKPNASVEDLLKELPGIQVDKDGKITAQGQQVQKILVDGDEFFSDDPTIATKNLRADAIQKVQVFDKKSDQAEFTGIDDGQKTKTINLEMKESAKHGYFGKLSAGGLDRYYNFKAMINAFKAKRKMAAFGVSSSTGETGLDWQNAGNYGFNPGNVQLNAAMGGVTISSKAGGDLGSGNFSGTGLPESIKAGLHYSDKWLEDKVSLGTNYLFNNLKLRNRTNDFSQNILENSVYYSNTNTESNSDRLRNDLSGVFDLAIDSLSTLKINARGSIGKDDYRNSFLSENLTSENNPINKSDRRTQTHYNSGNESINALYRKKFKKAGKTLSINLSQNYSNSKQDGLLYDESLYFDPLNPSISKKDTTDQNKVSNSLNQSWAANATYTQPLSQVSFLVFEYSFANNKASNEQLTYDKGANSKYEALNDSLSNNFKYIYNINKGGVNYRYTKGKINFSAGGSISNTAFRQENLFKDTTDRYSYLNFYPRADFSYKFSSFRNFRMSYSGNTTQPTISQIQPLIDNSDPLSLLIGNPLLKQSFSNNFDVFFTDVKVLSERYIFLGANLSLTNNEINESYFLDSLGRKISQYVNTDGNYTSRIFAMFTVKIPHSIWRFGVGPIAQVYRYANYVNFKESITNTSNLRLRTTLQGRIPEKFEINFAAMPGYNISQSNISKAADQKYWSANVSLNANYQLPGKLEIGSDVSGDFRQKINAFDRNNNIISWNAYIEKHFLKNDVLTFRASMFDILDQNKGFNRYQLATGIQEQRYLTFGQYGLITLTYNFVNKGGKGPDKMGGFRF